MWFMEPSTLQAPFECVVGHPETGPARPTERIGPGSRPASGETLTPFPRSTVPCSSHNPYPHNLL